jgi:hypothetical protein
VSQEQKREQKRCCSFCKGSLNKTCHVCQEAEESEMCRCAADESENAGNFKPRVTRDSPSDRAYVISNSYCSRLDTCQNLCCHTEVKNYSNDNNCTVVAEEKVRRCLL